LLLLLEQIHRHSLGGSTISQPADDAAVAHVHVLLHDQSGAGEFYHFDHTSIVVEAKGLWAACVGNAV